MGEANPPGDIRDDPGAIPPPGDDEPVPEDAPVEIRFLRPEEAASLAIAIYRSYGPSYDAGWVYRPAEVERKMRAGTLRSIVGIDSAGDVVGHLGLSLRSPEAIVGEAGQAVTDPRWRGHHLFTTLKRTLAERCRTEGLAGMFSEATAAHPYSQKANIALGAKETGILVGYVPATVTYGSLDVVAHRHSVVLYYLKTNDGPPRALYPPRDHRRIVAEIAERAQLRGRLRDVKPDGAGSQATALSIERHPHHGGALVNVRSVGPDLRSAVGDAIALAVRERFAVVYVDLPLADPGTEVHGDGLDDLACRFGGIFPNLRADGDVLRLQYLNGIEPDTDDISLAAPEARGLLTYVLHPAGA